MAEADDVYRRQAEIVYVQMRQMHEFSLKMLGEYGKWLISSLLFLHGAAIGGLLFKTSGANGPPPFLNALWWFVGGIVLALAAGFSAWWNFTFAAEQYHRLADVRMLNDRAYWPAPSFSCAVEVTKWTAIITGVLSVACIVAGAAHVACTWR